MRNVCRILSKEIRLFASPLSFCFLAFSAMTLVPNYPPLVGAFFVCLGIFYSYQNGREANDILYSALLPIRKRDVVRAKFLFTCALEICSFFLFAIFCAVRNALSGIGPYAESVMMTANPVFLAFVLLIFALYNLIFIAGFFKTAYRIGIPFLSFCITATLTVGIGETLHHIPGLEVLNDSALDRPLPWIFLTAGILVYSAVTFLAERLSEERFEKIDL